MKRRKHYGNSGLLLPECWENLGSVKSLQDFVLDLAEKMVHGVQPSPASRRSF